MEFTFKDYIWQLNKVNNFTKFLKKRKRILSIYKVIKLLLKKKTMKKRKRRRKKMI
jgi:hypothetical protein